MLTLVYKYLPKHKVGSLNDRGSGIYKVSNKVVLLKQKLTSSTKMYFSRLLTMCVLGGIFKTIDIM